MLTDKSMKKGEKSQCSPISWKSFKLRRRTQSTLASEAMALVRSRSELLWSRAMWRELTKEGKFNKRDVEGEAFTVEAMAIVDNKPIYDYIHTHGFSKSGTKDKRAYIDALNILAETQEGGVVLRWVDTAQMLADGLTKIGADTTLMRMIMEGKEYGISKGNDILKDKTVAKAKHQKERAVQIKALKDIKVKETKKKSKYKREVEQRRM